MPLGQITEKQYVDYETPYAEVTSSGTRYYIEVPIVDPFKNYNYQSYNFLSAGYTKNEKDIKKKSIKKNIACCNQRRIKERTIIPRPEIADSQDIIVVKEKDKKDKYKLILTILMLLTSS